jgi:hypothetical protein
MRIHPVEAELFNADGRTDRHDEANSHFLQFCEFYILLTECSDVFCIYLRTNCDYSFTYTLLTGWFL